MSSPSPSSSSTPTRSAPPKRLTLSVGPRPLHLGTGSFPSPLRSASSPLATPPTTAPLPPRRLGSVSHIAKDDLAIDIEAAQNKRSSGLSRSGSLSSREVGAARRGKHGASMSVALGGAGEGALERAQKEVLERKRMSASSSLGTTAEDQPPPVLTLAEKHKDLLHFIAQKESKCVELRAQLATHEADLLQLKKKWEKIVAKGNGQGRSAESHTSLSLGRLDATGAVDLVRGIFGGLGELAAPSTAATPATPSSSSSVSTPNYASSPLPSAKPTLASKGHLSHTPQSSSSSNSTALSSGTAATRLSLSSASSLGGAEQLKETKETAEPVGEDEDMDAWGPFESVQTEEPESAGALGLSGVEDKAGVKAAMTTNEQNPSWVPTAVGKKWEEIRGTETYAKSTKRASTLLSDMSSALTTTLNALAPPPTPSLTRGNSNMSGISPRPSPSIKLTTARSKPSTPSKPSPAVSVSLLDDDDGNEGAGLGAVLQPSPSASTMSKLSDAASGKMGSDTFGEDWNW